MPPPPPTSPHMTPSFQVGTTQLLGLYVVDDAAQFDAAIVEGAVERSLRSTRGEAAGDPIEELTTILDRLPALLDAPPDSQR